MLKHQQITDSDKDLGLVIVNVFGLVFHWFKQESTDRQTDKQTDGQTDATKRIISPATRSIINGQP